MNVYASLESPSTQTTAAFMMTQHTMRLRKTTKQSTRVQKKRPVFFSAALQRLFHLKSWRRKLRAASAICSFLACDITWWLREGIWHVPATLSAARNRQIVRLRPDAPTPSLDVYAPPRHVSLVIDRLNQQYYHPAPDEQFSKPIILYVHGGAWGSGNSSHYSQLATRIVQSTQSSVLVLSYRLYPSASIPEQAEEVKAALQTIRRAFPSQKLIVFAHSSGAHITSLALLKEAHSAQTCALADVAIFTAGPFHLMHHFLFESYRGVALVSPMLPAALADTKCTLFNEFSPTVVAESLDVNLAEVRAPKPSALEGQLAGRSIPLPDTKSVSNGSPFPKTYVMTSTCDTVVPIYSSIRFAAALRKLGLPSELLVYDFVKHADFILDWSKSTKSRDLSDIFDTEKIDHERRLSCIASIGGKGISELMNANEIALGPSAHVRDVLRIINAVSTENEHKSEATTISTDQ